MEAKPEQAPQPTEDIAEEVTISTTQEVVEDVSTVDVDIDIKHDQPKEEEIEVSLDVQEAPRFTQTLQRELVVYEGHSIELVCFVVGKPVPTVTWYKEEEDITISDRYISTYENGRCTLTINNITVDEEAEFICKAVNEAGSVTTFVDIFVEKKRSPPRMLVREEFYRMDIELEIYWRRRKPLETPSAGDNPVPCSSVPEAHSTFDAENGARGNNHSEVANENNVTGAGPCPSKMSTEPKNSKPEKDYFVLNNQAQKTDTLGPSVLGLSRELNLLNNTYSSDSEPVRPKQ